LQQTTRIAEQHFAIISERDTACRPPEQWTLRLKLKPFDLLADCRLRQVEALSCTMEATAIGDSDEGTQQFEIQHRQLIHNYDQ
jgi:hypothetical protein